jgi:hypothetical protein
LSRAWRFAFCSLTTGAPAVVPWRPQRRPDTSLPGHAGLASSFGNRIRLNAALANTNSQSTLARPRSLTLRIQAIVFNHPNAGSMRGRAC